MDLDFYDETYDVICDAIIKTEARLLEIGCGPGNISKYLLAKRPDFMITGIDIAPNMIELAKVNNPAADFQVMDARQISKLNTTFDGIIVGFCLPYLSLADSSKLIADSTGLLHDGGLIYLSFVEGDPAQSGMQTGSTGDQLYFYYHRSDFLQSQLTENGFRDLRIFNVAYKKTGDQKENHTILIAKKKPSS